MYYSEENAVIHVQVGMEVKDLMLYGSGLSNGSVKFTSFTGSYGEECKTHDGNQMISCAVLLLLQYI